MLKLFFFIWSTSRPKRRTLKETVQKNIVTPKNKSVKFNLGLSQTALLANAAALKELKKVDGQQKLNLNLNRVYAALSQSNSKTTVLDSPLSNKKFTNDPNAHKEHSYPLPPEEDDEAFVAAGAIPVPSSSSLSPPEKDHEKDWCSLMGGKKTRKKRKRRRKTRRRTKRRVKKHRKRKTRKR